MYNKHYGMEVVMIRVIATDMDGTLLGSNHKISKINKEALLQAQSQGIHLILASGRPLNGLIHQMEVMGLQTENASLLAFNGAIIVDAKTHEIHISDTLPLERAQRLINHLKNFEVNILITQEEKCYARFKDGYNSKHEAESNGCILIEDSLDQLSFRPHKILVSAEPEYLDSVMNDIAEPFKDELDFVKSEPYYLECLIKNENKGRTLARFCELKGISLNEVIAFGDNYNDIELIQTAGIGVAMGNAVESLKKVADFVTDTNDQDGISKFLVKKIII